MTTVKVRAEIDSEGKLRLEIPIGLPPGSAEVLVVVQPEPADGMLPEKTRVARSGVCNDNSTPVLDVDTALCEMNQA